MKIYLIRNEFDSGNGERDSIVKAYATKELAELAIKTMIENEIKMFIDDGTLIREDDGTVHFGDIDCVDEYIEISDTELCLRNDWNFSDEIWIQELDVMTA